MILTVLPALLVLRALLTHSAGKHLFQTVACRVAREAIWLSLTPIYTCAVGRLERTLGQKKLPEILPFALIPLANSTRTEEASAECDESSSGTIDDDRNGEPWSVVVIERFGFSKRTCS